MAVINNAINLVPGPVDYVYTSTGPTTAPNWQIVPGTLKWGATSSTSFTAAAQRGYILTSTSAVTVDMIASPNIGDQFGVIKIVSGGFSVEQAASQNTYFSATGATTAGTGHGIQSSNTSAIYRKIIFTYVK